MTKKQVAFLAAVGVMSAVFAFAQTGGTICIQENSVNKGCVQYLNFQGDTAAWVNRNVAFLGISDAGVAFARYAADAGHANNADSATTAGTATYALDAGQANYAPQAGNANTANTANYAADAGYANTAGTAGSAGTCAVAAYALDAGAANYAPQAGNATTAGTATYALDAGAANYATSANSCNTCTTATSAGSATTCGSCTTAGTADYAADAGNLTCLGCIIADRIGLGAVTRLKIGAGAVDHTVVADGGLLGGNITPGGIGTPQLASMAVTNDILGPFAVTEDKIDAGAITSVKILDGAVQEGKIATGAVTVNKIGLGAVTEAKIDTGAVTVSKIGTGAVTEAKLDTGAVTETKIGTGAVTVNKIGTDAVTDVKILNGSVTENKIGTGAVTTVKIADGNITGAKVADYTLTGNEFADGPPLRAYDEGDGTTLRGRANSFTNIDTVDVSSNLYASTFSITASAPTSYLTGFSFYNNTSTGPYAPHIVFRYKTGTGTWPATSTGRVSTIINSVTYSSTFTIYGDGVWHTVFVDASGWGSTISFPSSQIKMEFPASGTNPSAGAKFQMGYFATGLANGGSASGIFSSVGNVGIGATPSYGKLEVAAASAQRLSITNDGAGAESGSTGLLSQNGSGVYIPHASVASAFSWYRTGNALSMKLDSSGRLGINVTPTYQLEVGGSTAQFPTLFSVNATGHATSRRAGMLLGDWLVGQDSSGNGTKDFFVYGGTTPAATIGITTARNVVVYKPASGVGLTVTGAEGAISAIVSSSSAASAFPQLQVQNYGAAGGYPVLATYNSRGSVASPSQSISGDLNGVWVAYGRTLSAFTEGTRIESRNTGSPGASTLTTSLDFWTSNNAANAAQMRLAANGALYIGGAANAEEKLEIRTATNNYGMLHSNGTIKVGTYISGEGQIGTKSNHDFALFANNGAGSLRITAAGQVRVPALAGVGNRAVYSDANGALTNTSSDGTLKEDVQDLRATLRNALQLRPVSFLWKDKERFGPQREIGFIAQEVMQVVPEVVGVNNDGTYTVDYPKLVAVLVGAIQELFDDRTWLARRVQELEDKAAKAEQRLADLEARLARLEAGGNMQ